MSNIIPLHFYETRPRIFNWKLKSSTANKQILQILSIFKTSLKLFSTICTIQNFFSSPFPLICNINQRRIKENIKLFNCKKMNRLFCRGRKKINWILGILGYGLIVVFDFSWIFYNIHKIFLHMIYALLPNLLHIFLLSLFKKF